MDVFNRNSIYFPYYIIVKNNNISVIVPDYIATAIGDTCNLRYLVEY